MLLVLLLGFGFAQSGIADHGFTLKELPLSSCYVLPQINPKAFYIFQESATKAYRGIYDYKFKQVDTVLVLVTDPLGTKVYEKEVKKEQIKTEQFRAGDWALTGGWKTKEGAMGELKEAAEVFLETNKALLCPGGLETNV